MVMFHRIPYAEAQRRGLVQDEILEALTAGVHDLDDVDYAYADRLIAERLDVTGRYDTSQLCDTTV
jgi:kynurenine 3-monooxygenase